MTERRGQSGGGTDAAATGGFRVEPVKPSYVQVAVQLRGLILSGDVAVGERLPPEAELSAMFGVSRSTTREALRLLAAENLVETRRGVTGGTFVRRPDPNDIENSLATALMLTASSGELSRHEIVELWRITQGPAARMAARNRSDDHVTELMRLSDPDTDDLTMAELPLRTLEFHHVLLDAAGNRLLGLLTRPLATVSQQLMEEGAVTRADQEATNVRHRPIAEAIAAGDEELAARLIDEDLQVAPILTTGPQPTSV